MRRTFQAALDDFGGRVGLSLPLSDEGDLGLEIDGIEIGLSFIEAEDSVQLTAIVGALPDEPTNAFHMLMMSGNHLGAMTAGAALGYDLEATTVTLNRRLPADWLTSVRLEQAIEEFADLVAAWRDNYAALLASAEAEASDEDDDARPAGGDGAWIRM